MHTDSEAKLICFACNDERQEHSILNLHFVVNVVQYTKSKIQFLTLWITYLHLERNKTGTLCHEWAIVKLLFEQNMMPGMS